MKNICTDRHLKHLVTLLLQADQFAPLSRGAETYISEVSIRAEGKEWYFKAVDREQHFPRMCSGARVSMFKRSLRWRVLFRWWEEIIDVSLMWGIVSSRNRRHLLTAAARLLICKSGKFCKTCMFGAVVVCVSPLLFTFQVQGSGRLPSARFPLCLTAAG